VSIRRAFKRLAMELHPDRHGTSPEDIRARNAARFAEASAAYHLLVA
jgi:curved DNA-binding protein CbpA